MKFTEMCERVSAKMLSELNAGPQPQGSEAGPALDPIELQKRSIMGYEPEVALMKKRIAEIMAQEDMAAEIPPWYSSPDDAVFHENWGLAGMSEWFGPKYADSSSAKIIGERVYFLDNGAMKLMPQRIPDERREQLVRALLLRSPDERLDRDRHEVYMSDGTRVTIFRGGLAKKGLDSIVFRRYIIPNLSFGGQAERGTIPDCAVPLFEHMAACGFNVVFCGSVRSAKTTFLSTWQRYEDPALEGVMVETDPEIPLHRLMPDSPIIQLIADGDSLANISKSLMRSDADYFILAEARDGVALDTAVRLARKGTRRMKMTFHTRDPKAFARDAAVEIVRAKGGDIGETMLMVAGSFDYVFHFSSMRKDGRKKLTAIYEMSVADGGGVCMREICRYNMNADAWRWTHNIGQDKRDAGMEEDADAFTAFDLCLKSLHDKGRLS
ncbi:MAG: CpaF/VirB11 family protein [Clostridiales Family XIII bacterium]|jgi:pilus assembly protein CpaF|nr:CpaF/VirB11 family protein [Clostridiales Family XIII bacterium]